MCVRAFSFSFFSVDFNSLEFGRSFCSVSNEKSLIVRLETKGPSYCWNELITLSTKYRDLTANSQLAFTVSLQRLFAFEIYLNHNLLLC